VGDCSRVHRAGSLAERRRGELALGGSVGESVLIRRWLGRRLDSLQIHRDAEEAFHVLSGVLAVHAGGRRVDAAAGSFALIPRGLAHTLANPGTDPVHWLTLISPAERSEWIEAEYALLHSSDGTRPPRSSKRPGVPTMQ
jgi:mannose-6-phosphate isomerase-like protein (cupin superfamily)